MNANLTEKLKCPFCGNGFSREEQGCKGKCGLIGKCSLICCPRCGYSFVEESKTLKWLGKLWGRSQRKERTP